MWNKTPARSNGLDADTVTWDRGVFAGGGLEVSLAHWAAHIHHIQTHRTANRWPLSAPAPHLPPTPFWCGFPFGFVRNRNWCTCCYFFHCWAYSSYCWVECTPTTPPHPSPPHETRAFLRCPGWVPRHDVHAGGRRVASGAQQHSPRGFVRMFGRSGAASPLHGSRPAAGRIRRIIIINSSNSNSADI